MLALLDGEDVSLLLCCVTAERSRNALGSPTRQALSSCSAGIPPLLLGSFSAPSPFLKPPAGSAIITLSFHGGVILLTALFLSWSTPSATGPNYPGHQVQWARPPFNSSLCAPAGKRSNSVSVYGILQESSYLLTVLLQVKRTCLHPPRTVK